MHRFTIGVSHRVLWDLGLVRALNTAHKIGYSAFELWAEPMVIDPLSIKPDVIENLRVLANNLNLKLSVHAAHWDMNIASFNPRARRLAIQYAKGAILIATLLNAKTVIIHPGIASSARASENQVKKLTLNGLSEIISYALDKGINVAIENLEYNPKKYSFSRPSEMNELLSELNSLTGGNIGIALDISHASTVMNPMEYIDQLEVKITHIHLSDANKREVHLPIGEGSLNFESIIKKLLNMNYENLIIIEGYIPRRNIQVAQNNFKKLMEILRKIGIP